MMVFRVFVELISASWLVCVERVDVFPRKGKVFGQIGQNFLSLSLLFPAESCGGGSGNGGGGFLHSPFSVGRRGGGYKKEALEGIQGFSSGL